MLKAVTFKAAQNFKANLYALEVRSRFINQSDANGYYDGYGNSLSATVIGTSGITIGSGAFVVQGRMVEVISSETVSIAYQEGKVGYIICRIETCPAQSAENCTLVARVGSTLSGISLTQENVYQYNAETANRVYEYPIYSFAMQNNAIQNVVKLISPIKEISEIKSIADTAKSTADAASATANTAKNTADAASATANTAKSTADANASDISKIYQRLINLGFRSGTFSFGGATQNIYREGNIAYCTASYSVYISAYGVFTLSGTLCTLPAQFRPQTAYTASISAYSSGKLYYGIPVTINTDGTVVTKYTLNIGYNSAGNQTWYVNLSLGHKCPPIS